MSVLSSVKPPMWPLSPELTEAPELWRECEVFFPFWPGSLGFSNGRHNPIVDNIVGVSHQPMKSGYLAKWDSSVDARMSFNNDDRLRRAMNGPEVSMLMHYTMTGNSGSTFQHLFIQGLENNDARVRLYIEDQDGEFGELNLRSYDTFAIDSVSTIPNFDFNKPMIVGFTGDTNSVTIYANGEKIGNNNSAWPTSNRNDFTIGNWSNQGGRPIEGHIGWLGIWSRALPLSEIYELNADPFAMLRPRSDL